MIIEYLCKSVDHSHFYKAAASHVAAKRFCNYLRRYTKDRPTKITILEWINNRSRDIYTYTVEWYTGPKREGMGKGVIGEWFSISGPN